MTQIILASASPRRAALLDQLGVCHTVCVAAIDETPYTAERPKDYVQRVAATKSLTVQQQHTDLPVLAADTTVVCQGQIFGKPANEAQGLAMLKQLSGRTHEVYTAVSLRLGAKHLQALSCTYVTFKTLSLAEMRAYWRTGEPVDKAGGYALQGMGGIFARQIVGSFSGVVGLPLFETATLLAQAGVQVLHD